MRAKYVITGFLFYLLCLLNKSNAESLTYISTERPAIIWYDPKVIKNLTVGSRRMSRRDPRHYMDMNIHILKTFNHNNMKLDFYFYQFLTNRYRRSFVEMHLVFCNMLHSDPIFGAAVRNALGRDCPLLPGPYNLKNMTIPFVPKGFPFSKGRIYCNATYTEDGVTKPLAQGRIDMEIKVANI